ncbi:hypothetical protein [Rhodococcus koreensis]|uniref:THAP4-like heme-binding beta-barrel domain-containing protein n=1 Tax=Rhodococcus koreensis TaxID=99653 RepID=A0A1H4L2Q9_9NOCA|nr:hypothetical protein [Rhodococcus koreensis]SEB64678.1 hypothetical protein SAMN04490239_1040 [Rhodococcus koreensis]
MSTDVVADQTGDVNINLAAFDGVWRLAKDESTVLDEQSGEHVKESLTDQKVEIRTGADGVQTHDTYVQITPELRIHEQFVIELNDDKWVPYTLLEVDGDPSHPRLQGGGGQLLKAGLKLGEPSAWLKMTYIDERTTVRVTKNLDGSAQYVLISRLSEDGNKVSGYLMTPDGKFVINKHLVRESA